MSVKSLEKLAEVSSCVVGARGGLGMVLDGKDRVLAVPHAFDGPVIEVKVGYLEGSGAGDAGGVTLDGESVVL